MAVPQKINKTSNKSPECFLFIIEKTYGGTIVTVIKDILEFEVDEMNPGMAYLKNINGTQAVYDSDNHNYLNIGEYEGKLITGSYYQLAYDKITKKGYCIYIESLGVLTPINQVIENKVVNMIGTAVSNRGDYDISIAGFVNYTTENGVHVLTSAEINANTLAIVARNNANGVKRVLRETTVEQMILTVVGGKLVSAEITGRAQTDGGTLDRYTTTITL